MFAAAAVAAAASGAATAPPAHGSCPHAAALTARGSCPHAIPHYSLNKRVLLPDLESPRNLSFNSLAHRHRINSYLTHPEANPLVSVAQALPISAPWVTPRIHQFDFPFKDLL